MIPSVSPSAPIRRTSFAVISSLSRFSFSLSFALIVQHLQAKKITVQRHHISARQHSRHNRTKRKTINQHHNRCAGESGVLCFVFHAYIIHHQIALVKTFFAIFSTFFKMCFPVSGTTKMSMEKYHKKIRQIVWFFLLCIIFHENFCRFSSQLNIYKTASMVYNDTCWWATACQVPLFCTPHSVFAKCQAYDISALKQSRCAFFIFQSRITRVYN